MKLSLLMLGILAGTVGMRVPAIAQDYPWCAQYSGAFGDTMNCGFVSNAQCMATVSGMGGFCVLNNTYQPPVTAVPSRRQAATHHDHKRP
jgi:Protein of unknown function (DUF3551)